MPCLGVKSTSLSRVSSRGLGTEASRDDLHMVNRECRGERERKGGLSQGVTLNLEATMVSSG